MAIDVPTCVVDTDEAVRNTIKDRGFTMPDHSAKHDVPQPAGSGSQRAAFVVALICASQFVLQLDFSIVNVALPSVQRELDLPAAQLQWIVTGYALSFGSLLLAGGRLADLLGRRQVLTVGLALFGIASLACGLAQWPIMLIAARIVQGAAGAMVSPAALSLLTTTSAEGAARHRALAIWQATTAAGATAGIVAGGLLTQYFGWRAVFLINLPVIAVILALVPRLPTGKRSGGGSLDVRGALLVTTGIAALIFGLSSGQQHGFTTPTTLVALALAVLLTTGFVVAEKRSAAPMLPLPILAEPARRAAIAAMLLIGAILAGYVYFASLYLQRVLEFSPVTTGLALVPSTGTVVLVSTFGTRWLTARFSVKALLLAGLACMGAGQLWLAQITAGAGYPAAVLPGMVLTAAGVGLALPTASIAITNGVRASDQGLAGALFTTSQQTGAAVGLAVLATAAAATTGHSGSPVDGYRLSFLIATALAVLATIIVTLQLGSTPRRVEPQRRQPGPDGTPNARTAAQLDER
ncbi:MFS transporter [Streptomyces sp. NPDC056240]|uniref:MFS transporter n=1 Tax=unclassified Streptomyces TaxID=2593676 RepID=UPI0035DFE63A